MCLNRRTGTFTVSFFCNQKKNARPWKHSVSSDCPTEHQNHFWGAPIRHGPRGLWLLLRKKRAVATACFCREALYWFLVRIQCVQGYRYCGVVVLLDVLAEQWNKSAGLWFASLLGCIIDVWLECVNTAGTSKLLAILIVSRVQNEDELTLLQSWQHVKWKITDVFRRRKSITLRYAGGFKTAIRV